MSRARPDAAVAREVIAIALGDQIGFARIRALHGLGPDEVRDPMRRELRPGSYVASRKRLRQFTERLEA